MHVPAPAAAAALALSLAWAATAAADDLSVKQPAPPGWHGEGVVVTPESSVPKPGDAGNRMHTNTKVFVPSYGSGKPKHPKADDPQRPAPR